MSEFDQSNLFFKGKIELLEEENRQLKERLFKVQENEKKFRMFFEKSKDPFLLIKDFKFIDANPAALRMLKIQSLNDLQNTHPSSISPEFQDDGKPSIIKANEMMNLAITKGFHSFEWRHIDKDGNPFDVIVSLTPIVINNELYIFTHWLDYGEFRKKEKENDTFEKIIDAVVERHISLISITDINGTVLFCSKTYKTILGFEPDEIINKTSVFSMFHPDDLMNIYNIYSQSFQSKRGNFAFLRYKKKDGTYCIVETFGSPIFNERKEVEKVVYLSYILKEEHPSTPDIESKFFLNNLFNILPYPFFIIQSKNIIYLNDSAERLFGWNSFEIAGSDYSSLFFNKNDFKNIIENPGYKISSNSSVTTFKKNNGETFSCSYNIVPSNPDFNNEAYIVLINNLIEDRDQLPKSVPIAESQPDILKDIILDNLSYELRTPLNGIIGAAQYLKTYVLTKDDRKFAELITESSSKLLKTLTSIIDLSELEAGAKVVSTTSVDLVQLIKSTISNFARDADYKGIFLLFDTDLQDAYIYNDPLIISNILNPLIDNAIKFTKYGEVIITLSKLSQINKNYKYIIKVKDTGVGIEEEGYNSIFQAFKKSNTQADHKLPGLGLGLAIVKKYSDLGKIDIDFTSQIGFGTTFSIYIPDLIED